jgi:hypothetical protein
LEVDVSRPLLEEKCMMATVSGTNVQLEMVSLTHKCMMEMVSWTHKCMMEMVLRKSNAIGDQCADDNGLMDS